MQLNCKLKLPKSTTTEMKVDDDPEVELLSTVQLRNKHLLLALLQISCLALDSVFLSSSFPLSSPSLSLSHTLAHVFMCLNMFQGKCE